MTMTCRDGECRRHWHGSLHGAALARARRPRTPHGPRMLGREAAAGVLPGMIKTAEAYFYEFRASADTDAAMSLLRSRDALLYLALMAAHLGEGQIVDGQSLAAMIGPFVPSSSVFR